MFSLVGKTSSIKQNTFTLQLATTASSVPSPKNHTVHILGENIEKILNISAFSQYILFYHKFYNYTSTNEAKVYINIYLF